MKNKLLLLLAILPMLLAGCGMPEPVPEWQLAPAELQDLYGMPASDEFQTSAQYVLVVYWKKSCIWCMEQLPVLDRLQRYNTYYNYATNYMFMNVVAINVADSAFDVSLIMGQNGYMFTNYVGGELPEIAKGTPFYEFYIGGTLMATASGYMDYDTLIDWLQNVINTTALI
jgi:hypothetical protein